MNGISARQTPRGKVRRLCSDLALPLPVEDELGPEVRMRFLGPDPPGGRQAVNYEQGQNL
jgi:hypothetical protein